MKRSIVTVLLCIAVFCTAVAAQPRGNRVENQLKRLQEKVGLSEDQAAKVKTILHKAQESMRAEFEKSDGDRETRREAMRKRTEQTDAEIEKLLSKEQKPKFAEYKKERQKEMQDRMRERQ